MDRRFLMDTGGAQQVQFRPGEELKAALRHRQYFVPPAERPTCMPGFDEDRWWGPKRSLGSVARRDLQRYYRMLHAALPTFSQAEARLLHAALGDTVFEGPEHARWLWAGVDAAIRDKALDQTYGVDGAALVQRLRDLPLCAQMALVDALERVRAIDDEDEIAQGCTVDDFLRAVRLVKDSSPEHPTKEKP